MCCNTANNHETGCIGKVSIKTANNYMYIVRDLAHIDKEHISQNAAVVRNEV